MAKYLLLLPFLLVVCKAQAQHTIIDAKSGEPVSYAHIKPLNGSTGIIAHYSGEFVLDSIFRTHDSLRISCIGYKDKLLNVNDLKKLSVIKLIPSERRLNTVTVSAKKVKYRQQKIGVRKKPKSYDIHAYITKSNGQEQVTWIPNTHSTAGLLKAVNVYLTDGGYPDAHFRVHVYNCGLFKTEPGVELTRSNIIASGTRGNEWVEIPLATENIVVSENGCFIGIEWFDSPKSWYFNDTLRYKGYSYNSFKHGEKKDTVYTTVRKGNGVVLGTVSEKYKYAKNKIWRRDSSGAWVCKSDLYDYEGMFNIPDTFNNGIVRTITESNFHFGIPCIYLDVAYPKHRLKPEYRAPKKRKFKKIKEVEQDLYKYPQANVSDLFSSLIKAFENNEVVYVFKHLCVYQGNDLELILNELSIDENEDLLTLEERTQIIEHLKEVHAQLPASTLKKLRPKVFELNAGGKKYILIAKDGLWKVSPVGYKIYE